MRVYRFGKNQFYESADYHGDNLSLRDLGRHVNQIIKCFTNRGLFRDLLELYGREHDLEGYILLIAHGHVNNKKWVFSDGKIDYIVQNWIDKIDGRGLGILLACCNPKNDDIHSEKSIIIHPKDKVGLLDIARGGHSRIFVPKEGYLEDDYYRLRKVIEKFR